MFAWASTRQHKKHPNIFCKCCQTDKLVFRHPEGDSIFTDLLHFIFTHFSVLFYLSLTLVCICVTAPVELLQQSLICWRASWPIGAAPLTSRLIAGRPHAAPGSATVATKPARKTTTSLSGKLRVHQCPILHLGLDSNKINIYSGTLPGNIKEMNEP